MANEFYCQLLFVRYRVLDTATDGTPVTEEDGAPRYKTARAVMVQEASVFFSTDLLLIFRMAKSKRWKQRR